MDCYLQKGKCKTCTLGGKPPDTSALKSKLTEEDLRLLVNAQLNMSQKCALEAKQKRGQQGPKLH